MFYLALVYIADTLFQNTVMEKRVAFLKVSNLSVLDTGNEMGKEMCYRGAVTGSCIFQNLSFSHGIRMKTRISGQPEYV